MFDDPGISGGHRKGARAVALAAALSALLGLTAADSARAGRFHVYSCHTPSGGYASTAGWDSSTVGPGAATADNCATQGSLDAELQGQISQPANAASATWHYRPPDEARIVGATLWRYGRVSSAGPNATTLVWLAAPADSYDSADVFDQCVATSCSTLGQPSPALGGNNSVIVPAANQGLDLYINASCGGTNGYSCPATGEQWSAEAHLYAADFTLVYNLPPDVTSIGGALASAQTVSGIQDVSFHAAEHGPGLYRVLFQVDGQTVQQVPVGDGAAGHCTDAGATNDGTLAFIEPVPCKQTADVNDSFDTRQVSDGMHELKVLVRDAAGNDATVLDRRVAFSNGNGVSTAGLTSPSPARGAENGAPAADKAVLQVGWATTRRPLLTSRYGQRRIVRGRLTDASGHGIAGAAIEIVATPSYPYAAAADQGVVRTAADGSWSYSVPGNASSRSLLFRYRSHLADAQPAATAGLQLAVKAGILLHIRPRTTGVHQTITFQGRLLGGPIPPGGKQLVLEARQPGAAWIQFRVIRTTATGRFRATYTFRFPGPVLYQFQVLSKYEAEFPFIAGTSNIVGVYER